MVAFELEASYCSETFESHAALQCQGGSDASLEHILGRPLKIKDQQGLSWARLENVEIGATYSEYPPDEVCSFWAVSRHTLCLMVANPFA